MIRTIIAAILLASTTAHAVDHDTLCLQYQKLAELTKRQVDEGYPLICTLPASRKWNGLT